MALTKAPGPMLNATLMHEKVGALNGIVAGKPASTSKPPKDQVRIVSPHEYKEAAACLAEAFRDDHVVRYPGWSNAFT